MDALQGRALPAELRTTGFQGERQIQILGWPRGRSVGRRPRPGRSRAQGRTEGRHPDPLRDARGLADRGGRRGARRHRPAQGPQGADRRQGCRAGVRWLREQCRDAHALSRPDLGLGQGARHALQHGRRHQHGAGDRRQAARQLVGRPCRRLGHECAGIRRPRGRRQFPEAFLSARHHGQCQRRALRRRGCRLPQLHLRQVRRGDPEPTAAICLADLRFQGARQAARRIPHQAHDQGARRHDRGTGQEARRRRRAAVPQDDQGMERRGHDRGAVQSRGQGRPQHTRTRSAQEQLGQHHRRGAVRGLRRDLRADLHLRRLEDQHRRRSREHRRQHHPRPVCGRRIGRRTFLSQLPRRRRAGVRCGAGQARG